MRESTLKKICDLVKPTFEELNGWADFLLTTDFDNVVVFNVRILEEEKID